MNRLPRSTVISLVVLGLLAAGGLVAGLLLAGRGTPPGPLPPEPKPVFARPSPPPTPPPPTPPPPTYQPVAAGVARADVVKVFFEIAPWPDKTGGPSRVSRWETRPRLRLRGQPAPEDQHCVAGVLRDLASIIPVAAPTHAPEEGNFEVYLLPKSQWTSVYPEAPLDRSAVLSSWWSGPSPGVLIRARLLIDRGLDEPTRCFYARTYIANGLGFYGWSTHPGTVVFAKRSPDPDAKLSPLDRELLRLLYSPVLTPGLTVEEARRRLE